MSSRHDFHAWLLGTQIGPTFDEHPSLQLAYVYVVPRLWELEPDAETVLLIFYSARARLDIDGALAALVEGRPSPNLPAGVHDHALWRPVVGGAFAFWPAASFSRCARDPDTGGYGVLDGYSVYARVRRDGRGLSTEHCDERLRERIDRARARANR